MVYDLACRTMDHLGTGQTIRREAVRADCYFVGQGYGLPTQGMLNAVKMLAELEGLLFDPVYSGKGLDGMITLVREGALSGMNNIVFVHTGGSAGLFGYQIQTGDIFK
ncbi:pyridoxal-phosphate dependent enzyme [Breoghania sp.]|uniref:pyridoxal-phosphate dependent enzyme n=1 Tax=Breoghania sp. TaxID=2065378 RepID=UPI00262324BA|nr:pyridoxal-phosphate dependent enzyme [Breoghania sp.]MDJ0930580.1 pyridoxal-phosphate dependent enzyme [Breoghania sp.]